MTAFEIGIMPPLSGLKVIIYGLYYFSVLDADYRVWMAWLRIVRTHGLTFSIYPELGYDLLCSHVLDYYARPASRGILVSQKGT